jgi:putative polyketide hydroxylase
MSTEARPHVAIVGGGPVGLTAAILLERFGLRATILERQTQASGHPKARGVRPRTMELFARWGLAGAIRAHGLPSDANRFIYCDSLVGEELGRSPGSDGATDHLSPMGICRVAQDTVEQVLLSRVRSLDHVELLLGQDVSELEQDERGVTLRTESGLRIDADYVIAADGVASTVRRLLDIDLEGKPLLGYGQSIYWRGDLSEWASDRLCIQFITGNRLGRPANIAPVDGVDRWVTMLMRPGAEARPEPPIHEEAVEAIHGAVGVDIDPEIIDIATWRLSAQIATRWRDGRVFLAGDAAHSFPPTGGFGMNTGVQDVDNLVWKIALVEAGLANPDLLDTYEVERIDIARSNAAWSVANSNRMRDIGKAIAANDMAEMNRLLEDQRGHIDATDQDLGYGYPEGALSGADAPNVDALRVARRGHRFPEAPVIADGVERSSILALGDDFALATDQPHIWETLADPHGVALRLVDAKGGIPIGSPGVLVRPDGIVAWVANPGDGPEELANAMAEVLRP